MQEQQQENGRTNGIRELDGDAASDTMDEAPAESGVPAGRGTGAANGRTEIGRPPGRDAGAAAHPVMDEASTVRLFGVRVTRLGLEACAAWLAEAVASGRPHQVVTVNPIMLMAGLEDPAFLAVLKEAEFVVPDGAGAVWAAKYIGRPVAERVPGIDLMHRLLELGGERGWRAFLLGADPDTIRTAWENLRLQYPKMRFVGYHDGYFGEEQDEAVIARIREARPDLLFVGRSMATQEPWIHKYKNALGVPVMMGVGGSFDVIAGNVGRAPVWMQQAGLEWLYRLAKEPSRWRRMLALPKFVATVVRHRRTADRDIW